MANVRVDNRSYSANIKHTFELHHGDWINIIIGPQPGIKHQVSGSLHTRGLIIKHAAFAMCKFATTLLLLYRLLPL